MTMNDKRMKYNIVTSHIQNLTTAMKMNGFLNNLSNSYAFYSRLTDSDCMNKPVCIDL